MLLSWEGAGTKGTQDVGGGRGKLTSNGNKETLISLVLIGINGNWRENRSGIRK